MDQGLLQWINWKRKLKRQVEKKTAVERTAVDADAYKYWAFVSYNHHDAAFASWLQRAIESYHLPRRLIGNDTPLGPVPAYLKPVFRDRSEMQAGADLTSTVLKALAQSRFLIVVCSPGAARSEWVNREIIEFKKLHGDSRVLAVIAAGEPHAGGIAGQEATECFPAALKFALMPDGHSGGTPLEPAAADLRPQGDGKRLGMLKLIAGMLGEGVGVDELVRRDAQRRAHRMTVIAVASLAGMAVMALLTASAVRQRIEAQSQRAQAEDLIEFMLGDVRKTLDQVGRLDALDSVGEKALAYYARQDPGALSAAALGQRSRAMHLIGEIREQRGQLDDALTAFRSAAATTSELLARSPNDGPRIFDHAQSVYWVGYIAYQRGQLSNAEDEFRQYRELAERLTRIDPGNADWQLEPAYADQNLGVVQLDRGRPSDALQSFTAARDTLTGILAKRPAAANDLAEADGWIAKALEAVGNFDGAVAAQHARLEVLKSMPNAAPASRIEHQMANASFELARLELYLGDSVAAETDARVAVEQAERLAESDGSNMFWLSEVCFDRLRLAEVELALHKPDAAAAQVELASPGAARLVASDATHVGWQVNLAGALLAGKARIALAQQRPVPNVEMDVYLSKIRDLNASGTRLNPVQSEIVATIELLSGDALARSGHQDSALDRWNAAEERLKVWALDSNYSMLTLLGRIEVRLHKLAEARTLAARVEASSYRHPAYASFLDELAHAAG
jgi:tetratricopeptide (TPR) repeat protein